jgi:hypothetical protein
MKVIAQRFIFLSLLLFGVTPNSEIRAQSDFKVTLLGTGTPGPSIDRFGPSTLVEAVNQKLLFDAGRGATIRLVNSIFQSRGSIDCLSHISIPITW